MDPSPARRVLAEGRFLRLVQQQGWEWVERVNARSAAVIVPLTIDGDLLFVEQYRVPLGAAVIEFPAGLVGDTAGSEGEETAVAARGELLEETGYEAAAMQFLAEGPTLRPAWRPR